LAEALGINPEVRNKSVTYGDELTAFARANVKFIVLVEKSFAEYVVFA
jgi:transcriptional repressor NF-X1